MTGDRDLPPGAGAAKGVHGLFGDGLVWLANLRRRPVMLGVRLVALDAEGRVFLVRHGYRPGWHLPGGAVEAGETARAAAEREAAEEGGLEFAEPAVLFHLYRLENPLRRDHVVLFVARGVREGADRTRPGMEIRARGFFGPDDLPEGTTQATRARIAEVLEGVAAGDHW